MKCKITFIVAFFIIIVSYITACRNAGNWLVKKDEPVNADAIVVLMGSIPDRVLQAADLYHQGLAGKVLMVETGQADTDKVLEERGTFIMSKTRLSKNAEISLGIPADSIIILQGGANSTQMEATIIRDYIRRISDIDTLLLVSSSFHTHRASMIFKTAFRKAGMHIDIFSIPSKYSSFNSDEWWKSKEGIETVMIEYLKMANFILFEKRKL